MVTTIEPSDSERAVAVIALAFGGDPVARWTYPDASEYLAHFPEIIRNFGGKAFAHGTADRIGRYAGAALWLPPGVEPDHEAMTTVMRKSLTEEQMAQAFAVFEQMGRYHPSEPHWYLPLIGVDPTLQGKGHGSALLRHALLRCDRERAPAYLESTNPANIPLYERHGFELRGTIQVGSSPPIFPMLRVAR